jgi:predicted ArsR family transcriptional regulator
MENGNSYSYCAERVLRLLVENGPRTKRELAALMPASTRTVLRALNALHSTNAVYVREYQLNKHGHASRIWAAGSGADALPPAAKTGTERSRDSMRRLTAEERDFMRARNRALARKPRRDPFTTALFGPAPRAHLESRK